MSLQQQAERSPALAVITPGHTSDSLHSWQGRMQAGMMVIMSCGVSSAIYMVAACL